jgi:hypothetical protein
MNEWIDLFNLEFRTSAFRDSAVVFDNKGMRPRSIEYRNEQVGGAEEMEWKEGGSFLANRRRTVSSKYPIRIS